MLCNITTTVYAASGSPNTSGGKRIDNYGLLEDMEYFPKHDGNNGCGIVAMGVLLQLYNDFESQYQGDYIPDDTKNYKKSYLDDVILTPAEYAISRANALRDDLDLRTPKFLDGLFGLENATVPSGQRDGLESYLKTYSPHINAGVHSKDFFNSQGITDLLDRDIPVLLTMISYEYYEEDDTPIIQAEKVKPHTVVAYGYKYVDGKIRYLAHFGWVPVEIVNLQSIG